ncbi:MAG: YqaE/Pmp3 family membrane protein [Pseudomonadota bacterium]|nr:YqaE/Pmp3 family membrane protein [Pseudomonadota bacterium]
MELQLRLIAVNSPSLQPRPEALPKDLLQIVVTIFPPLVAVCLTIGLGLKLWLNLILTLLFFEPDIAHACGCWCHSAARGGRPKLPTTTAEADRSNPLTVLGA